MKLGKVPEIVGETTITSENQVILPAKGVRALGWSAGIRLIVQVVDENTVILMWRPENWAEAFAGRLGDVFGTHEETIDWLEKERESWRSEDRDDDGCAR